MPVVSVGNLTQGGTGKTPMVEWLARWFDDRGVNVTLVSRGYKSAASPQRRSPRAGATFRVCRMGKTPIAWQRWAAIDEFGRK